MNYDPEVKLTESGRPINPRPEPKKPQKPEEPSKMFPITQNLVVRSLDNDESISGADLLEIAEEYQCDIKDIHIELDCRRSHDIYSEVWSESRVVIKSDTPIRDPDYENKLKEYNIQLGYWKEKQAIYENRKARWDKQNEAYQQWLSDQEQDKEFEIYKKLHRKYGERLVNGF